MKHIACCSFGKDSLATIILAYLHGEPLDEIVYARVMFDKNRSAEVPEHEEFINKVAVPALQYLARTSQRREDIPGSGTWLDIV